MAGFRLATHVRSGSVLAACLAAVSLTGCLDIGGPSLTPTLTAGPVSQGGAPQPISVSGGVEFVRFLGNITTDNECQKMVPELDRISESQGILELSIIAETIDGCPVQDETTWNYVGQLIGVEAGAYDVKVRHRFLNSARPTEVVFDGPITVAAP